MSAEAYEPRATEVAALLETHYDALGRDEQELVRLWWAQVFDDPPAVIGRSLLEDLEASGTPWSEYVDGQIVTHHPDGSTTAS